MRTRSYKHFDYIIIGGGPAGCVTAHRLIHDYGARVLLLEAGGECWHPLLRIPAGFIKMLSGSPFLTFHRTEPQAQLNGRIHTIPQAKILGGGSSINGLVYMRGCRHDFSRWSDLTGIDWSWPTMLNYYRRQEGNQRLTGPNHNADGSLKVSDPHHLCDTSRLFVQTLEAMGVERTDDFNDGNPRGVGYMQLTMDDGQRCSAVDAFLESLRLDDRLTVRTGTQALYLLREATRVTGVAYATGSKIREVFADTEVIVTAGAFGTPTLLLRSGIGPEAHLQQMRINTWVDLPGVGENLMDHHEVPVVARATGRRGYFGQDTGWRMLYNGLRAHFFDSGPATSNGCETCAFLNPTNLEAPVSHQLYCVPTVYVDQDIAGVTPEDGLTINACLLQPKARGTVRLRSADPHDLPIINPNYLGHKDDLRAQIDGLRFARQVLNSAPLRDIITGELLPGSAAQSDDELAAHCRRTVKTNYHPCGTCRMGQESDPLAVLTPDLRVKGTQGLRVFDVSAMPTIPSGNTNAPAMALADRAVDLMMGPKPSKFKNRK